MFNVALAERCLTKTNNMFSFAYAYNSVAERKYSERSLYDYIRKYNLNTNFVRGSKKLKVRATVLDKVISGISINRRLSTKEKPAIREYLGGKCAKCGCSVGLEIDHIDENRDNTQINNLQLLCGTCHNIKSSMRYSR